MEHFLGDIHEATKRDIACCSCVLPPERSRICQLESDHPRPNNSLRHFIVRSATNNPPVFLEAWKVLDICALGTFWILPYQCSSSIRRNSSPKQIISAPSFPHIPTAAFKMTVIGLPTVFSGILLLALLGGLSYLFFWKPAPPKSKSIFSDPPHCAEIIATSSFNGVSNSVGKLDSRAFPNQRLVGAFGINNAFTTTDGKYAREFRAAAAEKIKMEDSDWKRIAGFAQQFVLESVANPSQYYLDINLDSLVQCISLRLALHVLFGHNPLKLDKGAISKLAQTINDCWDYSKSYSPSNAYYMRRAKVDLENALTKLFPEFDSTSNSRDNPLNYILPAYETLWRIVLLCLIEISFRQNRQAKTVEWREVLRKFLADPTRAAFEESATTDTGKIVSVSHIVNEGLRLYPPTRRIHRMYRWGNPLGKQEILAANIEGMQRNPAFWKHPLTYNPSRWLRIGEGPREAFMPFGNKPFVCPAQKEFGPRMIGILVAALAVNIDPEGLELWYQIDCGPREALGDDEEIYTDRHIYESWWLERK